MLLALGGCGVVHRTFYIPVYSGYLRESTTCGWVPHGSALVPLDDTVSIALSMAPGGENEIGLSLQVPLSPGQSLQFEQAVLVLETASGATQANLQEFMVAVHGRNGQPGHFEQVQPTDLLEGRRNADLRIHDEPSASNDLFSSNARFPVDSEAKVTLFLPRVRVNGRSVSTEGIEFKLVTRTGVEACVQ
ncbi:MAG: hypothetical protein RJQ10_17585 [Haliea sp.]